MTQRKFFTSEAVTEGHPDKVCDQISDAILDAVLTQDPDARVAIEAVATKGLIHVVGELTTTAYVEIPQIVRRVVNGIGYTSSEIGFDGNSCGVSVAIGQQSPEIAHGVDQSYEARDADVSDEFDVQGAGDQGIIFGFASNETADYMPLPTWLSNQLAIRLSEVRKDGTLDYLLPDGKTQVTIAYEDGKPVAVEAVVISTQHYARVGLEQLRHDIRTHVIDPVLHKLNLDTSETTYFINPGGTFHQGGPATDSGLTGRKIIVDTYGGMARHGGGAFSGKDPSKVDRSAAYALRWVAKNVVAAGLAERCEVQVAYAIGKARPVGIYVDTFGTHTVAEDSIERAISDVFDLRPRAIIESLKLLRPIYKQTAAYGHFGHRGDDYTWEQLDRVTQLQEAVRQYESDSISI